MSLRLEIFSQGDPKPFVYKCLKITFTSRVETVSRWKQVICRSPPPPPAIWLVEEVLSLTSLPQPLQQHFPGWSIPVCSIFVGFSFSQLCRSHPPMACSALSRTSEAAGHPSTEVGVISILMTTSSYTPRTARQGGIHSCCTASGKELFSAAPHIQVSPWDNFSLSSTLCPQP